MHTGIKVARCRSLDLAQRVESLRGKVSSPHRVIAIASAMSIAHALPACSSVTPAAGSSTTAGSTAAGAPATMTAGDSFSSAAATGATPLQWSYTGETGPDHWGEMVASCRSGASSRQSPINIDAARMVPESPPTSGAVTLNYLPTVFDVENTGRTIEAVPDDQRANYITIDGTKYYLQQFHLHSPGEHTINGQSFPMELHIVNRSDDGALAALGVPLTAGAENAALAELFTKMPATVADEQSMVPLDGKIVPSDLIPSGSAIARYVGSLTTPPCTEPVMWSVILTSSSVSTAQLDKYRKIFSDIIGPPSR